jgi:penicillin amidase
VKTISATLLALAACGQVFASDFSYSVRGLEAPAEIVVDEWGVPHIYANTHYDAFFVQGFNAARDRLWQIDTWRRRGLGLLSAVFGEQYLDQDRAARLLLYRGDMYREWLAYGSDAKRIAEAFAAGINAYLDLIDDDPSLLPPEFELLDYRPARWNPADIVRIRSHGISQNVGREVARSRIVCRAGLETAARWVRLEPEWSTEIPDGLDPCDVPEDVLDVFYLGRRNVSFDGYSLQASTGLERDWLEGSNNWVVSPSRTATGRPILANDPHRAHSVPSLRYITHLVAPGMNVIGAGEPALPGISIGHNERIAFGLTIFAIDQADLYVYELNDAGQYRYRDGWESFTTLVENVPVRDEPGRTVTLQFSRHGPVVYQDDKRAFAIRLGFLEPGMAPYFGSVEYMRATNWREFVGALNRWGAPSENQVYADIDGNIGYKPAGLFPRRPNWDGLMPVPGDGRYEWDGFHDMDVLPVEFNPDRGFTGTANSMNLPADYPIERYKVSFEWSEPWRYDRIWQVLSDDDKHSLEDAAALQRDYRSALAPAAVARIPVGYDGPAARMLRDWDGELGADSGPAALFMVWLERHLTPAMSVRLLPEEPQALGRGLQKRHILAMMSGPDNRDLVTLTLDNAWTDTVQLLGPDPETWQWGSIHQTGWRHPLAHLAGEQLARQMRLDSFARGGSAYTANSTGSYTGDLRVDSGASYRQVIDVGNWDASRMTNAPGQSGDPRSPFYDNLLKGWAEDGAFPLLYSRDKVFEHAALSIELIPEQSGNQMR